MKDNQKKYRQKYVDNIIRLAKENPSKGFVVKLHPVEINNYKIKKNSYYDILENINNIYIIKESFPIGCILKDCSLLAHYGSTVSLESYIYNIPSLFIRDNVITSEFHTHCTVDASIDDYEQIKKYISEGVNNTKNNIIEDVLYNCFNWKIDSQYKPTEEISSFISGLGEDKKTIYYLEIIETCNISIINRYRLKILLYVLKYVARLNIKKAVIYYSLFSNKLKSKILLIPYYLYTVCEYKKNRVNY